MHSRKIKRLPLGKKQNYPNCGIAKGKRMYVNGTVNQIKKLIGKLALKIQINANRSNMVEIIHTDNRGAIFMLLRDANIKFTW